MTVLALQDMTWPEVAAALQHARVAILPVGSQEQHGPHLACSTDIAGSDAFARALAARVHPLAILAPPLCYGVSAHHLPFPGTLTLEPETFVQILFQVADSLRVHGMRRVFVVNGHGGNQAALGVASLKIRRELGVRMTYTLWPRLGLDAAGDIVRSGRQLGHACVLETSLMMHLRPDIVRRDKIAAGAMQPPLYGDATSGDIDGFVYWTERTANGALEGAPEATAELGAAMTERALGRAVRFVQSFANVPVEDSATVPTAIPPATES